MDITIKNMKMTNPSDSNDFWSQVFDFGKILAPWLSVGWVFHQAINKIFKYFSDSRDAELKAIVKAEMTPELEKVNIKVGSIEEKIDNIQKSIWELSKRP